MMNNKKTKKSHQNRFLRIINKFPIRALIKARDFYVKTMTDYDNSMNYVMGMPVTVQASYLPKSFVPNSSRSFNNEDLQASSTQNLGSRIDLDLFLRQQMKTGLSSPVGLRAMRSSNSVAMDRIDEAMPC
ncbi:Uncharacterized protein Adt_39678 [Abeliophyllum distichum]|uniref:Uncharacterized protein n=1 Tax=Abeliophyllum distichum TaxID=126358 RepID=A0ABD1Q5R8_9LAMI